MARLNTPVKLTTHEGAPAKHINAELQLRRSVMACLLWETSFYEDGETIADRITEIIAKVSPEKVKDIAIEARTNMKLRHIPLLIAKVMASLPTHRKYVAETLNGIIQRADELTEFLAIYWKDGKVPLAKQVKKGLAKAFTKFNAYSLAKYNRDGKIKLRDVLFMVHAKPKDKTQEKTWKQLIKGTLPVPDTWEVALSASKGDGKKKIWERLIKEEKLGGLAYLRNLRNMREAGVLVSTIKTGLKGIDTSRILPFRFISAAYHNPILESELEALMFKSIKDISKFKGKTAVVVDCSGSMDANISKRSEITRNDAACSVAILMRELCNDCDIYAYGDFTKQLPSRRGFALRDVIKNSNVGSSTNLGDCIKTVNQTHYDRIVVITDEQSHDRVPNPKGTGYVINVDCNRNGIGYGPWTHIDGWSESVIEYIRESEKSR